MRQLQAVAQQPGWAAYRKACDALYELKGREILAGGLTPEQYHHGTGFLRAIEMVATLPDTLTTVMTRVQTDAQRRIVQHDDGDALFVSSPYWQPRVARADGRPEGVGAGQDRR